MCRMNEATKRKDAVHNIVALIWAWEQKDGAQKCWGNGKEKTSGE